MIQIHNIVQEAWNHRREMYLRVTLCPSAHAWSVYAGQLPSSAFRRVFFPESPAKRSFLANYRLSVGQWRSVGFNFMAFPRLLDDTCHEAMLDHFVKVGPWQKDSELDTSKCPCPTPRWGKLHHVDKSKLGVLTPEHMGFCHLERVPFLWYHMNGRMSLYSIWAQSILCYFG